MTHPTSTTSASLHLCEDSLGMGGHQPDSQTLLPLELTLWHPATRYDRALMDATFAPDFHEFGRSGRRYTRAELLDATPHDFTATLHDFTEHPLSDTITLTTCISELRTP